MKINNRLKRLSSYIEDNSHFIDVGCDHALLGIYLVKTKNNIKVIASDIAEGPLKQAKLNIDKYDLNDSIKIKLGSGISTIEDDIDTIVISGMGGLNIVDILESDRDKLSNIKRIILSPNNFHKEVRNEISKLGFKILCEEIVFEKGKYYPIIVFVPGNIELDQNDLLFGYNVLNNNDLISYYNYIIDLYEKRLRTVPDSDKKENMMKNILYLKNKVKGLHRNTKI